MALKDITQQKINDVPRSGSYFLAVQNDADSGGVIKQSLRRVPVRQATIVTDKRDNKGYSVAFSVTAEGFPAATFTEITE